MKDGNVFSELEVFIAKYLHPAKIDITSLPELIKTLQEAFDEIFDQTFNKINQRIFNLRKENELHVFIYHCQIAETGLLNKVYSYRNETCDTTLEKFYNGIIDNIEQELIFLEQNFPDYLNSKGLLPLNRAENLLRLLQQTEATGFSFYGDHQASNDVTDLLKSQVELVKKFIDLKQLTFHQYYYWNYIINEIPKSEKGFIKYDQFSFNPAIQFLIRVNFNYSGVFQYLVHDIQEKITLHSEGDRDVNHTLIYIKDLHQLNIPEKLSLNPLLPSLKEQLLIWLQEELYFLERSQKRVTEAQLNEKKSNYSESAKLHTKLSVDQLGIVFRAAADIGLIEKKSYKSLFEKIAPFLSTPYTKNISPDSLRSKAYVAENRDKQIVKDILMELYKKISFY